jgi:hypothetical protein
VRECTPRPHSPVLKFSRNPVSQRRIVITNKRTEDEKKLKESYWLAFVAKLNPFYWFSKKWDGPTVPLSVGGCNATLYVLLGT